MFTTIWTVCCCTFTCYATCREHIEAICSSDIYIGMRCWSGRYGTDSEIWLCVCDKACMQFHLVMAFSAVLNHSNEPTIDEAVWLRNECRSLHRCKEWKKIMQSIGTEQPEEMCTFYWRLCSTRTFQFAIGISGQDIILLEKIWTWMEWMQADSIAVQHSNKHTKSIRKFHQDTIGLWVMALPTRSSALYHGICPYMKCLCLRIARWPAEFAAHCKTGWPPLCDKCTRCY